MTYAIAGCSTLAAAIAVLRLHDSWSLPAYLGIVALGVALAWIDLTRRRLPNRLVLPAIAASVPLLLGAALLDGDPSRWMTAVVGGAALFAFYLVLALVNPRGMGMGDVKLAALVGLYAGYLGLEAVFVAAFAGFLLGGLAALVVLRRMRSIPFGPWMLAGLWLAVALSP